jgi:hypothetical protein
MITRAGLHSLEGHESYDRESIHGGDKEHGFITIPAVDVARSSINCVNYTTLEEINGMNVDEIMASYHHRSIEALDLRNVLYSRNLLS